MPPAEIAVRAEAEIITTGITNPNGVDIDATVSESMPLARFLALQWAGRGVDFDDLESEASAALWRAALRYDPVRDVPFGKFARGRITWALSDLVADIGLAQLGDVTKQMKRDARKVRRAASGLLSEGIDRPTADQIAERTGLEPHAVREILSLPEIRAHQAAVERAIDE
jgi:RNA polymerase sigma factor for flagellar operon FliA